MDALLGYAVHFTRGVSPDEAAAAKSSEPMTRPSLFQLLTRLDSIDDTGFRASLTILGQGHIRASDCPDCVGAAVTEVAAAHRAACFSETRLDDLARLISSRSLYGVGFCQEFLQSHNGRRVSYLEAGSDEALRYEEEVRRRVASGVDPADPFWKDTPFVDIVESGPNDSRWQEEWRVLGGLNFDPDDVAFCFLPAHLHVNARQFFEDHRAANTCPAYLGPYLDPGWDHTEIERALDELPPRGAGR